MFQGLFCVSLIWIIFAPITLIIPNTWWLPTTKPILTNLYQLRYYSTTKFAGFK